MQLRTLSLTELIFLAALFTGAASQGAPTPVHDWDRILADPQALDSNRWDRQFSFLDTIETYVLGPEFDAPADPTDPTTLSPKTQLLRQFETEFGEDSKLISQIKKLIGGYPLGNRRFRAWQKAHLEMETLRDSTPPRPDQRLLDECGTTLKQFQGRSYVSISELFALEQIRSELNNRVAGLIFFPSSTPRSVQERIGNLISAKESLDHLTLKLVFATATTIVREMIRIRSDGCPVENQNKAAYRRFRKSSFEKKFKGQYPVVEFLEPETWTEEVCSDAFQARMLAQSESFLKSHPSAQAVRSKGIKWMEDHPGILDIDSWVEGYGIYFELFPFYAPLMRRKSNLTEEEINLQSTTKTLWGFLHEHTPPSEINTLRLEH